MQEFSLATPCIDRANVVFRIHVRRMSNHLETVWSVVVEHWMHNCPETTSQTSFRMYVNAKTFAIHRILLELGIVWREDQQLPELDDLRLLCTVQIGSPPCAT